MYKGKFEIYSILNDFIISLIVTLIVYIIISKKIFSNHQILFVSIIFTFIFLALSILLIQKGWPLNHEMENFKLRTIVYSDHMKQFDFFPLWSSSDAFGMGTPSPLFYHKFFFYISSSFFIFTSSTKLSLILTLGFFMFIGIIGMYKALKKLGLNEWTVLLLSVSVIFLNYSFTDWLVRGAMAEFTAMMMIPWLINWCFSLIKTKRFSISVSIILFLLYISHNITAVYSSLLPIITVFFLLISDKNFLCKYNLKRILLSIFIFFLLMSVFLIPIFSLSSDYNPSIIISSGYSPEYQFRNPVGYIFDNFIWLNKLTVITVKIDTPILISLILLFTLRIIISIKKLIRKDFSRIKFSDFTILVVLVIPILLFLYMQLPVSIWIYKSVTFLNYIQFPWRLLAITSPLMVVLIGFLLVNYKNNKFFSQFITIILIVSIILLSPLMNSFKYDWQNDDFELLPDVNYHYGLSNSLLGIGEYLPKVESIPFDSYSSEKSFNYYLSLKDKGVEFYNKESHCNYLEVPNIYLDQLYKEYEINCEKSSDIFLPLNYSSLHKVYITNLITSEKTRISIVRDKNDPRIRLQIPSGQYKVSVLFPSWLQLIFQK